jgi:hypothetical protein
LRKLRVRRGQMAQRAPVEAHELEVSRPLAVAEPRRVVRRLSRPPAADHLERVVDRASLGRPA